MLQLHVGHWTSSCPPAKLNRSTSDSAHSITAASTKLEATASQDASVVAPNMSTSVADPEPGSQLKQVCPTSALSEEDASTVFLDIGDVDVKCATDEEVVQSLRSLPPSKKDAYFHRHVKPEDSFTFPPHSAVGAIVASLLAGLKNTHGSVTASSLMVRSEYNVQCTCTCIGQHEREKNPPTG